MARAIAEKIESQTLLTGPQDGGTFRIVMAVEGVMVFLPRARSLARVVVIVSSLGLAACGVGVLAEFEVSLPKGIPPGAVGSISDGITKLRLPAIQLSVEVQNYRGTGRNIAIVPGLPWMIPFREKRDDVDRLLYIWLDLAPAAGEGWAVDPRRIVVSVDGRQFTPLGFIGPSEGWSSPRALARGCGARRFSIGIAVRKMAFLEKEIRQPTGPVPLSGAGCFLLWFQALAAPDQRIDLAIDGISSAGGPIAVPELAFSKATVVRLLVVP